VYGGTRKPPQANALRRGCELIVATPGRLVDFLDLKNKSKESPPTSLARCGLIVLDEADRMLDLGFEKEIRSLVWELPDPHQSLLYSATWPHAVQCIAKDLLTEPVKVTVGTGGEKLTANKSVTQNVHVLSGPEAKSKLLLQLLKDFRTSGPQVDKRVIVFANMKVDVKWLHQHCRGNGLAVDSISGDHAQSRRESVLQRFREGSLRVVIATDVCGRGLDIEGIEQVINYDFPGPEDYIHRIGRTGRAGTTGVADTFFTQDDRRHSTELIRILADAGQVVPAELGKFGGAGVSKTFEDSDDE